jgi:amino acid adenylation domain-containing protein
MQDAIEGFPLSPQQSDLWKLQEESKNKEAYCVQCVVQLEGKLDRDVFQQAVQHVVDRNEILRTVFYRHPGTIRPLQIVRASAPPLLSWGTEARREAFDLWHGPLVHLHVIPGSRNQHTLIITLPSLCMDTWTMQNLVRELALSYAGERLTDEPLRYVQFSQWQNELLEEDDADAVVGKEYWRKHFRAAFGAAQLPLEDRAADEEALKPATLVRRLSAEVVDAVEKLAAAQGTTAADVLLGCWTTLLHKLTGVDEVVVSVLADGQRFDELEGALGLLARSLPVRVEFGAAMTIGEVLTAVSAGRAEAERWQDYFSHEQLAQFGFEWQEQPERVSGGGLSWEIMDQHICLEPQKVKLVCIAERSGALRLQWQYDERVLTEAAMARLAGQYEVLLGEVVRHGAARPVAALEVMSASERQTVVEEYNRAARAYEVAGSTLPELFAAQVERTPEAPALEYEGERLSYGELNQRANQLGHYLRELGVGPETLVAVLLERSVEMVVGLLGVLKAGAAYVPIDPEYPAERVRYMLADCGARVLLTQAALTGQLEETGCRIVQLDYDCEQIAQRSDMNVASEVSAESLAYVIYTSGSTGRPKGVGVEHRQIVNYINAVTDELDLASVKGFAIVSTFSADLGNTVLFPSLTTGGCLHLISRERASDPDGLADYFKQHSIDCLKIVPSHFAALQGSHPERVLPRRKLILGGEASRWPWVKVLQNAASDCEIYNHYGPTETTVGVLTYHVPAEESNSTSLTIPLGRPLNNIQVYVLDSQMRLVPLGVSGELYIGGAGVARGYFHHPDLTAERFVPDPFGQNPGARLYRTGDIVRVLSDCNLEFLGRVDGQVKVRGYRIELGEIESVLCKHASIKEAVVSARELGSDKRLVAYVVGASAQPPNVNDLRNHAQAYLPQHMVPSWYVVLRHLPLTANGKIDKQALPDPETERPELETPFEAPTTSNEKVLAAIWSEVLGVEPIGIGDSFFALGGDSILSVRVVAQAKEKGLKFTIQQLFQFQTIKELAGELEAHTNETQDNEELARLLEEVDQLSEAQVLLKLEENMALSNDS